MVVAGLYLVIIIVEIIGLSVKKPRLTKGCNLTATIFYVLMYIFGIIVLIAAVVFSSGNANFLNN
jgi:hypothetical protein